MALTTNMYAAWDFNSSNSNDGIGSNNGTDTSITYSSGNAKLGAIGAGFASASSSKILLPDVAWGITTAFTFSAWIKTSTTGATQNILSRDNQPTRMWQFKVESSNNKINFIRFNSSNSVITNITSSGTVTDGNWHHIVATFDNTVGSIIYVDGSNVASDAVTTNQNNATSLGPTIGAIWNSVAWADFMNGSIDAVYVWTRALSSSEVTSLYNGGTGLQYPFVTSSPNQGFFNLR